MLAEKYNPRAVNFDASIDSRSLPILSHRFVKARTTGWVAVATGATRGCPRIYIIAESMADEKLLQLCFINWEPHVSRGSFAPLGNGNARDIEGYVGMDTNITCCLYLLL